MSADVHGNFRSVRFLRFDWENAEDLATVCTAGPYDFVLGSDIVYPGNASKVHAPWHCRPGIPGNLRMLKISAISRNQLNAFWGTF